MSDGFQVPRRLAFSHRRIDGRFERRPCILVVAKTRGCVVVTLHLLAVLVLAVLVPKRTNQPVRDAQSALTASHFTLAPTIHHRSTTGAPPKQRRAPDAPATGGRGRPWDSPQSCSLAAVLVVSLREAYQIARTDQAPRGPYAATAPRRRVGARDRLVHHQPHHHLQADAPAGRKGPRTVAHARHLTRFSR